MRLRIVATLLALTACGRTGLDLPSELGTPDDAAVASDSAIGAPDASTDVSLISTADAADVVSAADSASCNATTCPSGCCDATDVCQAGGTITQCGALGESCQNCTAKGFQVCDPMRHACGNVVASCDASTCSGCCEGDVCFSGTDPNECGLNGEACLHCESSTLACSPQRTCAQPSCDASNCGGCCVGNACVSGIDTTECGAGGQACANCDTTGGVCLNVTPRGGACEVAGGCTPQTCSGCCFGNICLPGTDPTECGNNGYICQNCAEDMGGDGSVSSCVLLGGSGGGVCTNFCGRDNCAGCCVGLTCMAGFDPMACGNFGEPCTDCTKLGETCGEPDAGTGAQCTGNATCPPTQPPITAPCPADGTVCTYGDCTTCLCVQGGWQCATRSPCQ
jgi:predicted small lipoprotein YifL